MANLVDYGMELNSTSKQIVACLIKLWQVSKPDDSFDSRDFGAMVHFGWVRAGEFNTWILTAAGLAVLNLAEREYERGVNAHATQAD
jgi:hypothetical protein